MYRYKELAEKIVQLLRCQFVYLSRLAFQNKKFVEQSNILFGLLSLCFHFPVRLQNLLLINLGCENG